MPPVVVAFPDCFTRSAGNQYIDSASTGAWEDFLLHEMLPAIAITHALRHSDIWAAAACHSGDMGFELC
jgi:hypothetical protein